MKTEREKKMVLLVNACARKESRTLPLAEKAAKRISEDIVRLDLYSEDLRPVDRGTLERREAFIARKEFEDDMFRLAHQFRKAENVVIAAPFWDLSVPAVLKCYIEHLCVRDLVFEYSDEGVPKGLCEGKRLVYVTTAGGYIPEHDHGYSYVRDVFADFFGFSDTMCIKAEGLDIVGMDVESILREAEKEIEEKV